VPGSQRDYVLPFPCHRELGTWVNSKSEENLQAELSVGEYGKRHDKKS
jgi:hypothetical protein